jgi:glycosyltransferase involved in cell wall biosynthesis
MSDKIGDCLASIFKQTYRNFEIIIVNDGSTDNFENKIDKLLDKFTYTQGVKIFNQSNKGAPAARNFGFKESKGEFLLFCDADSVLEPTALIDLLAPLEVNLSISYVFSSFKWGKKIFKVGEFSEEKLKSGPFIHTMSLIRRKHFPEKGWDESIKKLQDWDLYLTMLEEKHIGVWMDKILFTIKPGGNMSYWFPKIFYKLPFKPKKIKEEIEKYNQAKLVIRQKHGI